MGKHLMNMGDGTGIPWKMGLDLEGRFAFLLKDFIDGVSCRPLILGGAKSGKVAT